MLQRDEGRYCNIKQEKKKLQRKKNVEALGMKNI